MHATILGITGGLGCGKSTVARLFESLGYRRIDSDALVRDPILLLPEVLRALEKRFGPAVIDSSGKVNRAYLAERVFSNDSERIFLEELTHPLVYALGRAALRKEPGTAWVVEVPLLFEKSLENWFDFTVCVACSESQQLARLEQRGLPRALASQRIIKQLPLARKIELSDFVLWNEGSADFLRSQVDRLDHVLAAPALTSS